jgi:hypothetical protein
VTQSSPSTSSSGSSAPREAAGPGHSTEARPNIALGGATFTVTHSGTRYQPQTFPAQAARVLANPTMGQSRPGSQSGQEGQFRRPQQSDPMLTGCVTKVVGVARDKAVKLVDQARYGGRPATIIVVATTATQPGMVYVVENPCSASDARILAQAPRH